MKAISAALAILGAAACGSADSAPEKPRPPTVDFTRKPEPALKLTGRVMDAAGVIDDRAEQALVARLAALEQATSDQVVVVTVPSLDGEQIKHYSLNLARRWKIGRADVNNGVVILIAPKDRKVRVEVGLGLEGLLTDAKAADAIRAMLPLFGDSQFSAGIGAGLDQIDRLLRSDRRRPQPKPAAYRKAA